MGDNDREVGRMFPDMDQINALAGDLRKILAGTGDEVNVEVDMLAGTGYPKQVRLQNGSAKLTVNFAFKF